VFGGSPNSCTLNAEGSWGFAGAGESPVHRRGTGRDTPEVTWFGDTSGLIDTRIGDAMGALTVHMPCHFEGSRPDLQGNGCKIEGAGDLDTHYWCGIANGNWKRGA
jgi:hypothetical protein